MSDGETSISTRSSYREAVSTQHIALEYGSMENLAHPYLIESLESMIGEWSICPILKSGNGA